jgi:ABC-type branched-subunit amino acid transport system substrate-binding protein/predicted negative regulator of RcsB-dependent stress response
MATNGMKIISSILLSFACLACFACAGKIVPRAETPLVIVDEIPPQFRTVYEEAEQAFRDRQWAKSRRLYEDLLSYAPSGTAASLSRLRIGEILLEEGDFEKASKILESVPRRHAGDPLYDEARYALALLAFKQGDVSRSEGLTRELLKRKIPPALKGKLLALLGENLLAAGNAAGAVDSYLSALEETAGEEEGRSLRGKIEGIVTHGMTAEDLTTLYRKREGDYPSGYVLFTLARLAYESGDLEGARSHVREFLLKDPGHPLYDDGLALSDRLQKIGLVDRNAVGVILPLSGKFAAYGKDALDAIRLALELAREEREVPVTLFVEDSEGSPEKAAQSVRKLVSENRVIGIIGPMSGPVAVSAAGEAQLLQVPIVTLTQEEDIAAAGDFVFRNFLTPPMMMETLLQYAFRNMGMRRFAILHPNDSYGIEMMHLFWDEVERLGGTIRGVESYDPKQTDFGREIRILAGLPKDRERPEKGKLDPVVDFDALFIPDSFTNARLIGPQLAFYDVTAVRLLGTNLWNIPEIPKEDAEYLQGALFVDGFFRNSPSPAVRNFVDRFYFAYGKEPAEIEALAYDTMNILLDILKEEKVRIREDVRDTLLQWKNYPGVTGRTSFTPDGDVEKELYILTIRGDDILQVN